MNIYPINAFLEYMETDAGVIAFLAVYAVVMLAIMAVGMLVTLAVYIMNAIAVKRMSQKLGFEKPWLAWIPYANTYMFGKVSETPDKPRKTAKLLLLLHIVYTVLTFVYFFGIGFIATASAQLENGYNYEVAEVTMIVAACFMLVAFIAFLAAAIAFSVIYYIAFYRIAKLFGGSQYMVYFLLGLIPLFFGISISFPIAMLVLSGREPDASSMLQQVTKPVWPPETEIYEYTDDEEN